MKIFAVALMFLVAVILVVSIVYIVTINRTKERLAMIEKGLHPGDYFNKHYLVNSARVGLFLMCSGVGFLLALILDEYVLTGIDNPALYAGCIIFLSGLGLILFYAIFKNKNDE